MKTKSQNHRVGGLRWISATLPAEQIERLDELVERTYSNRSQHLRLAVAQYLRRVEEQEGVTDADRR